MGHKITIKCGIKVVVIIITNMIIITKIILRCDGLIALYRSYLYNTSLVSLCVTVIKTHQLQSSVSYYKANKYMRDNGICINKFQSVKLYTFIHILYLLLADYG